jgi:hypothetical protein
VARWNGTAVERGEDIGPGRSRPGERCGPIPQTGQRARQPHRERHSVRPRRVPDRRVLGLPGRPGVPARARHGPGIPPEERDRVFERFYRGSSGQAVGAGHRPGSGHRVRAGQAVGRGREDRGRAGAGFEASFPAVPTVP